MSDQPTFGGRYAVIEPVGTGGMAEVYRARDELLGRDVAVKVLSDRFSRDRAFVERFRREAQLAANLNHPNIVSLFDFGSDGDTYFIVMEFIDGRSLADIVRAEGPLLPERAAEIASDVAQALGRAHESGLVHRDVKPSNIMITSTGQTKVTDFGIARALASEGEQTMTQTGMVIGTAGYLSPEQAQGDPVDQRSDIYSLGCVLFESLTGRAPFAGDSPLAIAYKHVREQPERPSLVNRDVPAPLEAIVLKCLAKNPENRYSTALELNDDLQRYLAGQRVQATPVMAGETMVAPAATGTQMMAEQDYEDEPRRGAGWYVVIALMVLALLGGLAYFLANGLFGEEQVTVPDVIGDQQTEAIRKLNRAGLDFEILPKNSNKEPGEVLKQDPEGGDEADKGSIVTLTVSEGRAQVEVPDLEGLTVEEATEQLEKLKLKVGDEIPEPNDEIEEDHVIRTAPDEGSTVETGDTVDLIVSSGSEAVSVPFVEGQQEGDAINEIELAGLVAQVQREESDQPEGTVTAQDPAGGEEAEPGDTVVIVVSEGPGEESMPNVVGEDADDAEALLTEQYGLEVSRADEPCPDQPPGFVCRQEPAEGTPVSPGDSATIYIQPGDALLPRSPFSTLLLPA